MTSYGCIQGADKPAVLPSEPPGVVSPLTMLRAEAAEIFQV